MAVRLFTCVLLALTCIPTYAKEPDDGPLRRFLERHCGDCHTGSSPEADFDLTKLSSNLENPETFQAWVKVHDKLQAGEMPPPDADQPSGQDSSEFVEATAKWLRDFQTQQHAQFGRVRSRRLTRLEVERTLQDLLGIDIPLADELPEELRPSGFSTVADDQAMSHFQLEHYAAVVDEALDEAFRRAFSEEDRYEREFDPEQVAREDPRRRTREPEMRDGLAVVWSSGLIFYGRIPATTAPEDGWYRFRVEISGLKPPKSGGVWSTVRSGLCVSSAPLLNYVTAFEATDEPKIVEFEAWLPRKHMLEIRPADATIKKARFARGQVGAGEGDRQNVPGIAIHRLTMERIHRGPDNRTIRQLLFGHLADRVRPRKSRNEPDFELSTPEDDAQRLLLAFAARAFRRSVSAEQVAGHLALVRDAMNEGQDFVSALRLGYRAILSSPRLLYLIERPGRLDDEAIAARLSYMLTKSMPDARLRELAAAGELKKTHVLRGEVDRLLAGAGGKTFVDDFTAEWLDLDQIDFTQPDTKLFPEFDSIVQHSMLDETRTFVAQMLKDNLSVTHLIQSDFTYLNSRLARYYEIPNVTGDQLRKVSLDPETHRGGVLTQGAILKVTSNGSNTSPVVRGVWVSERLLGVRLPPPPDNIPAIEPDIRGATTIREQLAKHRSQPSCAGCHVKIDPPGFALENFDPAGQWRSRYLQAVKGKVSRGANVDASYTMPNGRAFKDVGEFRQIVVEEPEKLAANLAEKLLVYGTGAEMTFADRPAIESIVKEAAASNYGFRSIIHAVVSSPVFLSK